MSAVSRRGAGTATAFPLTEMSVQSDNEEPMSRRNPPRGRDMQRTANEASIRVEKAGKCMGAVVRNFDEYLIGPMVQGIYEWSMLARRSPPARAYDVHPLGFISFQARTARRACRPSSSSWG